MMRLLLLALMLSACIPTQAAMMANSRWDWEAYNWLKNNQTNGNALSSKAYLTGTRFMLQTKQWGLRSLLGRVNLYLGDNTNAMQVPIIVDWRGSYTNDDLVAFASGDYSETSGLTGNTTTKHLRCSSSVGLNISAFGQPNNVHYASYVRTASNESSHLMGVVSATGTYVLTVSFGGNTYAFLGGAFPNAADANGTGFVLGSRTSSTLDITYRNGTTIVTDASTNVQGLPNVAFFVHAINNNGALANVSSRTISYYGMGFGISAALRTPYQVAVENVQQPFGRKL